MKRRESARRSRGEGASFARISIDLGCHISTAYRMAGDVLVGRPAENREIIVRDFPHNGGCSTLSGKRPVSLPRIAALHGAYTGVAAWRPSARK
jgi:hypothetical protein